MATISNTPRPGYVWDSADNVWYPIGVGAHQHTNAADTPAVMPYSTYAAAGKNKIINGDFNIWQRGTTSSANGFLADRFNGSFGAATTFSQSRQTFTPGTAPVAGYEGKYFWRGNVTNAGAETAFYLNTYIEDVQTLAGQTATISFWAKADSARSVGAYFFQQFGTGGSTAVNTQIGSNVTLSTSWQRFSLTINAPSIAGKTIGTGSHLQIFFAATMATGFTFDIWGIQLEASSTATAFQTATGNPASELAACQRYYWRMATGAANPLGNGSAYSASHVQLIVQYPVTMRVAPALDMGTGTDYFTFVRNGGSDTFNSFTIDSPSTTAANLYNSTQISSTAGNGGVIFSNNASAYLGFTSEL